MSPIARTLVTPLAVAVVALVGDAALAAQNATVRHDYRLAALVLVAAAGARAATRAVGILWSRRKRPTRATIPYRTSARPTATPR